MAFLVSGGAVLACSMGAAPSVLMVLPTNKVVALMPMANIMDNKPVMNVPPFGMCSSMMNPAVAAATAAKLGVFTPAPCMPTTPAPWAPGAPSVLIGNMPALDSNSKLACAYGGVIQITAAGQVTVQGP